MPSIEFIVPLFNEEESLPGFHKLLDEAVIPDGFERRYIYVDDGSSDRTAELLDRLAAADSRVRVIHLSRNFGKEYALTAGLDRGSARDAPRRRADHSCHRRVAGGRLVRPQGAWAAGAVLREKVMPCSSV